jgi:2-haloacid dehalogenase
VTAPQGESLRSIRWATFDCYGTLIDWERGIAETFRRLWPSEKSDALLARYHQVEPRVQQGSGAPYRTVLADALRAVAADEGLTLADDEEGALGRSLPDGPPFPETAIVLGELRRRGWRLAILSNTDPELLDASIAAIGVPIEERITVREAGSYKPSPGHWERFFDITAADRARHVHVGASIFHDIEPAVALGLIAVWINRAGASSDAPRAAELPNLGPLPDVLDELVIS